LRRFDTELVIASWRQSCPARKKTNETAGLIGRFQLYFVSCGNKSQRGKMMLAQVLASGNVALGML
jgi:hypothetical protein